MNNEMIGRYGQLWMEFMETHEPQKATQMQEQGVFEDTARLVDRDAAEYCRLLNRQYAQQNPPPDDADGYRKWRYARDYYVDSAVMRERVLIVVSSV